MSVTNPTEVEKLQAFLDAEKAKGLVDFKITTKTMLETHPEFVNGEIDAKAWIEKVRAKHQEAGVTAESLAKEINEMLAAPTIPDVELL